MTTATTAIDDRAAELLRELAGPDATFREHQLEAVRDLVADRQRVLWPSTVRLSEEYFQSLARHAVPLNEDAIAALSHSAMALDVYAWLAQRLHRIPRGKPQFIPWKSLKDQFGCGYKRMNKFREVFLKALGQVHTQYRGARIDLDNRGMTLHHSPPPIEGRIVAVTPSTK